MVSQPRGILLALMVGLVAIFLFSFGGFSQETNDPGVPDASGPLALNPAKSVIEDPVIDQKVQEILDQIDAWKLELDRIELAVARESNDDPLEVLGDNDMVGLRDQAEEIAINAETMLTQLEPVLADFKQRLDQLGPAPKEGEPEESPEIDEQRKQETQGFTIIDGAVKTARLVEVQVQQLVSRIAAKRRDRFGRALLERRRSILNPALWIDAINENPPVFRGLRLLATDSLTAAMRKASGTILTFLAAAAAVAFAVWFVARRILRRIIAREDLPDDPSRRRKFTAAMWIVVDDGVIPVVAIMIVLMSLKYSGLLNLRLERFLQSVSLGASVIVFSIALARAMCAPVREQWRLVDLPSSEASRVVGFAALLSTIMAIAVILDTVHDLVVAPLSVEIAASGIMALLIGLLTARALRSIAIARQDRRTDDKTSFRRMWNGLRIIMWIAVLAILTAAVAGYVAIAEFAAIQMMLAAVVLSVLWILVVVVDETVMSFMAPDHEIGRHIARSLGTKPETVLQLAILGSGLVRLSLILAAAALILLPWGLDPQQWLIWIRRAFFGFKFGEINISPSSILSALLIFAIGWLATSGLQSWLGNKYLPNTRLDVGLRNSIRTSVGYLGITLSAVLAFSYLGLNLQNIALVAGALSLGIGFGLQSIINNFVSGLILLAERPIKQGDWIVVGAEEGYVQRISIRSTEIETFDRATVIVPNSDLITGTVKNWMHSSNAGRIIVIVEVAYDSDPEQVHDIMLDTARAHASILQYPEPRVFFLDFGDSALIFRLQCFLSDINYSLSTKSELRFEIFKRFREEGIEIPFPQQDIHLRDMDRLEEAFREVDRKNAGGDGE